MKIIKDLFDAQKDIYRSIEKVITYGASQEDRLYAEISEYIVTDNIDADFEKLISKMQTAMDTGSGNEIGVWVSGFYGSGKSSFTKYLGLALDDRQQVNGAPFLQHLQDRLLTPQTKAQLGTLAKQFPAAVVMLDLASEQLAGATMADVSSVLFLKTLQWAGYANNLKIAALERKLKQDSLYEDFCAKVKTDFESEWQDIHNDPLVVDSVVPELAHHFYPKEFKTPSSFNTDESEFFQFENKRVEDMLDIVREVSGKEYVIFIVDEVGQYVGSRDNLILNLDGLAKNVKEIGGGKAWIIGTAQQTLTEDDPNAALNSDKLFKLKDRFPIQIELESNDIREICHRRLLSKSNDGEAKLAKEFEDHGEALRTNTKLQDAKAYDSDFDKQSFIDLYPFLPAHFDILLQLLGTLAKSTGGIGLRSAIKVIQDILIEGPDNQTPVANNSVGWLATTVTLYDALEKDIRRAFPSVHKAAEKAIDIRFADSDLHKDVAKTVAVLQILNNMPVTNRNVAALMHPTIDSPGRAGDVDKAIEELIQDPIVPLGNKDGNLCFFSEKLNDIEKERSDLPVRSIEAKKIHSEQLRELFTPLPSTRLENTRNVQSGIKTASGNHVSSISGDREAVQTIVQFIAPEQYDETRDNLVDESREKASQNNIYLLGRSSDEIENKIAEISRCRDIVSKYRNDPDQEIKDYCISQQERAAKLEQELRVLLKNSLSAGSFIFRADITAVNSESTDLNDAAKKHMGKVAEKVFDRYKEAPIQATTNLAEKFLRKDNLRVMTKDEDPLGLIQLEGGTPSIDVDHKALVSIKDYIERNGSVEGKRLIDRFTSDPFGWSQDTFRYLLAALLCGGEIKLRSSGVEVTVNGQQAIEALRTNNSFKKVGVSLREGRPSTELLAKAQSRLVEITGEDILPLEDELSKVVVKKFPAYQSQYAPLGEKLTNLGLPGKDRIDSLTQAINSLLESDASEAPQVFGSEQSPLFEDICWAKEVNNELEAGLDVTVRELQSHIKEIQSLPETGVPGNLKTALVEEMESIQAKITSDEFFKHAADMRTSLTEIKSQTASAAKEMGVACENSVKVAQEDLTRLYGWKELNAEEQSNALAELDTFSAKQTEDLSGLQTLVRQGFSLSDKANRQKEQIKARVAERIKERLEKERQKVGEGPSKTIKRELEVPNRIDSVEQLEQLIGEFRSVQHEMNAYQHIEITLRLKG